MFTGIVQEIGKVISCRRRQTGARLKVRSTLLVGPGASVAINGVCLTALLDPQLTFDVVPETLRRTNLGSLKGGDRVNLEPAMQSNARLDGHVVQGHVDGVGVVESVTRSRGGVTLVVAVSDDLGRYVVSKGSITIDGVSLTVVGAEQDQFSVALIPYTLRHTTLGRRKRGDRVNIETDVLARYAAVRSTSSRITRSFLKRAGFV